MNEIEIEKILKYTSKQDTKILQATEDIISNTLKNIKHHKQDWKYEFRKSIVAVASIITIAIGGIGVYAVSGGTIGGKPVAQWLGINFSNSYTDYVTEVKGQQSISYDNTTVDLVSTMCDDGFTVLEFNVKLSKKDKTYLNIGESIYTEKDAEQIKGIDNEEIEKIKNCKNTVHLLLNSNLNGEKGNYDYNNFNLIIDGEKTWVRWHSRQTTEQISEYEYRIYQYYFLPENKIKDKTEFTLEFRDIVLINGNDINPSKGYTLINMPNNEKHIQLNGEIKTTVSKEKALENTRYINANEQSISYNGMEQTIEKISVTPMQTIIKVKTLFFNLDAKDIEKTLCLGFNVYNQDGELLHVYTTESERIITYSNGKQEKWEVGDVANNNFKGATMELTEYIAVGNEESIKSLTIVPTVRKTTNNIITDIEIDSNFKIDLTSTAS